MYVRLGIRFGDGTDDGKVERLIDSIRRIDYVCSAERLDAAPLRQRTPAEWFLRSLFESFAEADELPLGEVEFEYPEIADLAARFHLTEHQLRTARERLGIGWEKRGFGASAISWWRAPARWPDSE